MCGIGAILRTTRARREPSRVSLWVRTMIEGNTVRGTDAAGIAAVRVDGDSAKVLISKMPGHPSLFAEFLRTRSEWADADAVIVHDRAYTSCPPSNNWCNHPLYVKNSDGSAFIMVHNGVVNGFVDNPYIATVDSMDILLAVRKRYESTGKPIESVKEALDIDVSGSMAILMLYVHPEGRVKLFVYRNTNPLVYGEYDGWIAFASIAKALPAAFHPPVTVSAYKLFVFDVPFPEGAEPIVFDNVGYWPGEWGQTGKSYWYKRWENEYYGLYD